MQCPKGGRVALTMPQPVAQHAVFDAPVFYDAALGISHLDVFAVKAMGGDLGDDVAIRVGGS